MQRIVSSFKKNNQLAGLSLLILIMVLGYKAYLIRVESKIRELAFEIVTIHASYNEFLGDKRLSSDIILNEIKSKGIDSDNANEVIETNKSNNLANFWNNFFHTINSAEFLRKLESYENASSEYFSLTEYGKDLNLVFLFDDKNEPTYISSLGILIEGQYGVSLDKLIDDGSPTSGHMRIQQMLDLNKTSNPDKKCVPTNLKIPRNENLVDCDYVYLF